MKTYPDWGVSQDQFGSPFGDLAEIPSRLGYVSFRRSGRVIYHDDCEFSGPVGIYNPGVSVDGSSQFAGDGCYELESNLSSATIVKNLPPIGSRTMGVELFIRGESISGCKANITIGEDYGSGYTAGLELDFYAGSLKYYDAGSPGYVQALSIGSAGYWHNLKFTVDWELKILKTIWFDEQSIKLNEPMYTVTPSGIMGFKFSIRGSNFSGSSRVWFDEISITVDEAE